MKLQSLLKAIALSAMAASLAGCVTRAGEARQITAAESARPVIAQTETGTVTGATNAHGTAFLGIPFAATTAGAGRFAPPRPAPAWQGVRDATIPGSTCPQGRAPDRSEDCLNLNVYAPAGIAADERLPVMVWLYGGGLTFGSNRQYDGSALAERQRVIVVVPNYRLGALGFLAHPALRGDGEGNYGLLDQQAALKWVARNIAGFGGDPDRVTLFGESAGATSVCTHMVAPGSRGLFHRAILQSNTCVFPDQWNSREEAERGGLEMARELGCVDRATAAECLRALPADRLRKADSHRWGNGGEESWSPMVDGTVLPDTPRALFARGAAAPVPLLMGSNRDEGRIFTNALALRLSWTSDRRYRRALEQAVRPEVLDRVVAAYDDVASQSRYRAAADIITASRFACPMLTLDRLRADAAPTYVYEFNDPDAPRAVPTVPFTPRQGAYHGAELIYVFHHQLLLASPGAWDDGQRAFAARMQDHWGAFARTGDPNAPGLPHWTRFDGARPYDLSPGGTGTVGDFAARHRCDFWRTLGH